MDRKQAVEFITKHPPGSPEYRRAQAELATGLVDDVVTKIEKGTTAIRSIADDLGARIDDHRAAMERASNDATTTAKALITWTRVQAWSTVVLAGLTAVLAVATWLAATR